MKFKNGLLLILFVVMVFIISSRVLNVDSAEGIDESLPVVETLLTGKIAAIYGDKILLMGNESNQLFSLPIEGVFLDENGRSISKEQFDQGQQIEVGYSGVVKESYPAIPIGIGYIKIIEKQEDMIGLYNRIINELWQKDSGLNHGIEIMAFDLSKVSNLTDLEKETLVYISSNTYQLEGMLATYDELVEQGLINELSFETGILIEIDLKNVEQNRFDFEISKWRSGIGAYFFMDCEAKKMKDGWRYEVGVEAIASFLFGISYVFDNTPSKLYIY